MRRLAPSLLAAAALLAASRAHADDGRAAATNAAAAQMYRKYCGACHGPGGRGDGVAGSFMSPHPPDLTQITKQNGGEFPFDRVMASIDGTRELRPHGTRDMPVWGEVFADQAAQSSAERAQVRGRLQLLTEYLRSIQAP